MLGMLQISLSVPAGGLRHKWGTPWRVRSLRIASISQERMVVYGVNRKIME